MSDLARKRWQLLGEVLSRRRYNVNNSVSVRRFTTFGLLTVEKANTQPARESDVDCTDSGSWFVYSSEYFSGLRAFIRHVDDRISIDNLLGFNNTGNVCVWPSEEIMAYYCMKHLDMFQNKSVCELGGGMTCLAGVAVAVMAASSDVLLTDGNEQSVTNVQKIIDANAENFKTARVSTRLLRWSQATPLESLNEHFDIVLCADCLFFDEGRQDLATTINQLLKPQGEAIIFAPQRGSTFQQFVDISSRIFAHSTTSDDYDDVVTKIHQQNLANNDGMYDQLLHYPLFLRLRKGQ